MKRKYGRPVEECTVDLPLLPSTDIGATDAIDIIDIFDPLGTIIITADAGTST